MHKIMTLALADMVRAKEVNIDIKIVACVDYNRFWYRWYLIGNRLRRRCSSLSAVRFCICVFYIYIFFVHYLYIEYNEIDVILMIQCDFRMHWWKSCWPCLVRVWCRTISSSKHSCVRTIYIECCVEMLLFLLLLGWFFASSSISSSS